MKVKYKLLDPRVQEPKSAHSGDAAFDLQCKVDVNLQPGERRSVPTGLAVAIPEGYAGLVLPRSGHARRFGLGMVNAPGLIDAGYRGEIEVLLINHGEGPIEFVAGDRIAQLVLVALPDVRWVEVEELEASDRGTGGFGSTGV